MSGEYFHVRRLIWDDICPHIRPSEAEELRCAIGNQLIDGNGELKQELGVLVEILSEFQQQSDGIREALVQRHRQRLPEPPGRALLLDKLKLLASDLHAKNAEHRVLQSAKEREILKYVLSADDSHSDQRGSHFSSSPPSTPRMVDLSGDSSSFMTPRDIVMLRPGTSSGNRPSTASSRPVSRGSTLSATSSTSSIVESPELRERLNVEEIDSIKEDVQEALLDERQQLLEDIDFIQGCIEMEQELLDDDRRRVTNARPPPSLQDLQDLRRALEKTLEDQEDHERMEAILSKTETSSERLESGAVAGRRTSAGRALHPLPVGSQTTLPRPPPRDRESSSHHNQSLADLHATEETEQFYMRRPSSQSIGTSSTTSMYSSSTTKVLKIRHVIQEARDEPFLT